MLRPALLLPALLPVATALAQQAQQVDLTPRPSDQPTRYRIETTIKAEETRKTMVDGEEAAGRGGRGPAAGATTITQKVVLEEGPASAWRNYLELDAVQQSPGRDGQARESAVEGGLKGKKVFLKAGTEGALTLVEGEGEGAAAVDARLARGVPDRIDLSGFLPRGKVAVGESFALNDTFLAALRGLVHPVTPAPRADGEGRGGRGGDEQGGGRGEGGEQGGRGGRRPGGQGDRGGRRGFGRGGAAGPGGLIIDLLGSGRLAVEATGKVEEVREVDGREVAVVAVEAQLSGKGTGEELGLGAAGGRGRGGDAAGTDTADATIALTGRVHFDLDGQRVTAVELGGSIAVARATSFTRERDGESSKVDTVAATKGTFKVAVACPEVR